MRDKLAIVASGGGLTCSYSAGSILALIDKYRLTDPDIVIGGSGGAGTMSYYVSRQYQSIRSIWENLLCTSRLVNNWRLWKVMDVDYLVDEIFKKQEPLDTEAIYNSEITFLIPATNVDTGEVRYFSNHEGESIFELLRATEAMPLAYGKVVKIGNSSYCDTFLSASIEPNIQKAKKLGATKIIVLDNTIGNQVTENGLRAWVLTRSSEFRRNFYKKLEEFKHIEYGSEVFFLRPKGLVEISTFCNDKQCIKHVLEQGYKETMENEELNQFINSIDTN